MKKTSRKKRSVNLIKKKFTCRIFRQQQQIFFIDVIIELNFTQQPHAMSGKINFNLRNFSDLENIKIKVFHRRLMIPPMVDDLISKN